jgi:hypothetical protein
MIMMAARAGPGTESHWQSESAALAEHASQSHDMTTVTVVTVSHESQSRSRVTGTVLSLSHERVSARLAGDRDRDRASLRDRHGDS